MLDYKRRSAARDFCCFETPLACASAASAFFGSCSGRWPLGAVADGHSRHGSCRRASRSRPRRPTSGSIHPGTTSPDFGHAAMGPTARRLSHVCCHSFLHTESGKMTISPASGWTSPVRDDFSRQNRETEKPKPADHAPPDPTLARPIATLAAVKQGEARAPRPRFSTSAALLSRQTSGEALPAHVARSGHATGRGDTLEVPSGQSRSPRAVSAHAGAVAGRVPHGLNGTLPAAAADPQPAMIAGSASRAPTAAIVATIVQP